MNLCQPASQVDFTQWPPKAFPSLSPLHHTPTRCPAICCYQGLYREWWPVSSFACWQKHAFLIKAGDRTFPSISGSLWGRMECSVNPTYALCFLGLPSPPDSLRKLALTARKKHGERERWDLSLLFSYHERGIENWGKGSIKQFLTKLILLFQLL